VLALELKPRLKFVLWLCVLVHVVNVKVDGKDFIILIAEMVSRPASVKRSERNLISCASEHGQSSTSRWGLADGWFCWSLFECWYALSVSMNGWM